MNEFWDRFKLVASADEEVHCIAYGSNLNVARMKSRCPGAEVIGTSMLGGYRLLFKKSMTGFYATIEQDANCCVPVVVYRMTAEDEARLDRFEGYPKYYYKREFLLPVWSLKGRRLKKRRECIAYIMHEKRLLGEPTTEYYRFLDEGYDYWGFEKKLSGKRAEKQHRKQGRERVAGRISEGMQMTRKYYIAYGSNLSVEQMAHRCPDAKVAGMAAIPDWKLVFRVHATIEPAEGRTVPVLIWEISERDERNLDRYEGYPTYYYKQDMTVTMTDLDGRKPQEITAMVYLMADGHPLREPWKGYLDTLEEGYQRFGFNPYQLELALKEAKEGTADE